MIVLNDIGIRFKKSRFRGGSLKSLIAGSLSSKKSSRLKEDFWALRHVTMKVERGEIMGVVGRNGAGKSTLLRAIAGIYEPDEGSLSVEGKVSTLLSLGTGFKQDLNGLENIFLNGVILGLKRKEIEAKLEDIISFAELEHFIEEPVKHYSSGMKARLGFSVSVHMKCDIMLIDEILGVGDHRFREKSQQRLLEVIEEGRTVVLVTHNMESIKKYCNTAVWLDKGMVLKAGAPEDVVEAYLGDKRQ